MIYKLLASGEWAQAQPRGRYDGSAVDLHDGIGQSLVGMSMTLDVAREKSSAEVRLLLEEVRARLRDVQDRTRHMISDLSPPGLYDLAGQSLRYFTRVNAFTFLIVDELPPFGGDEEPQYPVRLVIAPRLEEYNRWKTGLRFILIIPVQIVLYLLAFLNRAIGILSWLVIVITGRQPKALFDVMKFVLAYEARAYAYHLLVTETYPPFAVDDGGNAPAVAPPPAV